MYQVDVSGKVLQLPSSVGLILGWCSPTISWKLQKSPRHYSKFKFLCIAGCTIVLSHKMVVAVSSIILPLYEDCPDQLHLLSFVSVETSRTKLDDTDSNPAPTRKVIKPDLSLLMSTSFDVSTNISVGWERLACWFLTKKRTGRIQTSYLCSFFVYILTRLPKNAEYYSFLHVICMAFHLSGYTLTLECL